MPRACSICTHNQRVDIDKAIIDGTPNRRIASQYGMSERAVRDHKRDHIPQYLAENMPPERRIVASDESSQRAAIVAHETVHVAAEQRTALDLMAQLVHQLERINLLSDAVDEWLRDPEDPTRYSIDPRAEDVSVIYREEMGEIVPGTKAYSARRKERLSVLLGRLEGLHVMIEATETKHADPRELLIKASDAVRGNLQTAMSYLEKLYGAQQVELFQQTVLEAIGEVEPDVRRHIEENLRRRHPLRRLTGGAIG